VEVNTLSLKLTNGAFLAAGSTGGDGEAGDILINTQSLEVIDRSFLLTSTNGNGDAGNVLINTSSLKIADEAALITSTVGNGNAGNIVINSQESILVNNSNVLSQVNPGATGNGGNIEISTSRLDIINGSILNSGTASNGNAGSIVIDAQGSVVFDNSYVLSSVSAVEALGDGGNLEIAAHSLESKNTLLATSTLGNGDAGNIIINAQDNVVFDSGGAFTTVEGEARGNGGDIEIATSFIDIINGARVSASTTGNGDGDAGNVAIIAYEQVNLQGSNPDGIPSGVFTSNDRTSTGQSNDIFVTTPILFVQDGAVLFASTLNNQPGGDITLSLGRLAVLNGGQIIASSEGTGPAGTIRLNATDGILVAGSDPTFDTRATQFPEIGLFSSPQSTLSVRAGAGGTAGNLIIGDSGTTPRLILDDGGQLIAESATGDGGNIVLTLNELLVLRNGGQISTTAGTAQAGGNGGNITIQVPFIVAIPEENSDISADAFEGTGGNINITAQGIFGLAPRPERTALSDITASSALGLSGVVSLNVSDTSSIANTFTELPGNLVNTDALVANSCIIRSNETGGTFVVTGSDSLPQQPTDSPRSTYILGTVQSIPGSERVPAIVEPQGVYQLADGRLVMSRECE
jgi:large exoprotein involved in heme utilization and adhesion